MLSSELLRDQYWLVIFESLLSVLFVVGLARDCMVPVRRWWLKRRPGVSLNLSVLRGPESRRRFYLAHGFAWVIIVQVVNSSEAAKGCRTFLSLYDLALVIYLTLFNHWFRNKLLGIVAWWEKLPD